MSTYEYFKKQKRKKNDHDENRTLNLCDRRRSLYHPNYCFRTITLMADFCVSIRTSRHLIKKRFPEANHDTTPAPQRPPPAGSGEAGTMRRDEETADREVDLISSYFEKGMHPGLKMIFESLTAQHQQYRTYMYTSYGYVGRRQLWLGILRFQPLDREK